MNENIKNDSLDIVNEILDELAGSGSYVPSFKKISEKAINIASIFQEKTTISLAVIAYALYKMLSHPNEFNDQKVRQKLKKPLEDLRDMIKDYKSESDIQKKVTEVFDSINAFDVKFKKFIEDVIFFAKIKKGSKIHEGGLSIARSAQLLGVSRWDILNYVGKLDYEDSDFKSKTYEKEETKRLELARGIFND